MAAAANSAACPGPSGDNTHSCPSNRAACAEHHEPGMQNPGQHPGPSTLPQHGVPPRPVFYVPAPTPPPLLPYQWPLPFSYNSFPAFPGMGYGMVLPPFAPPHYMESPAYILPHAHLPPLDYRRFLHPASVPYPSANHGRRVRPPGAVRETVNSAVQTEPTQRPADASPPIRSDSGNGSATDSPSSSSSVTNKQLAAELHSCIFTSEKATAVQAGSCTRGSRPAEPTTVRSGLKAAVAAQPSHKEGQEKQQQPQPPPSKNTRRTMWSVDSQESLIPVCSSSQQEEELPRERRSSFPDILMSWGGGTPHATLRTDKEKVLSRDVKLQQEEEEEKEEEEEEENENQEKGDPHSPKEGDTESLSDTFPDTAGTKALGFARCVRKCLAFAVERAPVVETCPAVSDCGQEGAEESSPEEPTELAPPEVVIFNSSSQSRRKLNESVWSVESLCPFVPSKDWAQHRSVLEAAVIAETGEEPRGGGSPGGKLASNRSASESVPVSDSWLVYDTPAEKRTASKRPDADLNLDPSMVQEPSRNVSPPLRSQQEDLVMVLRTQEVDEGGSSGPEEGGSPDQEPAAESGTQARSSATEDIVPSQPSLGSPVESDAVAAPLAKQEGAVPPAGRCAPGAEQGSAGSSPSKGPFVDFGVQCSELLPCSKDCCEDPLRKHLKYSDLKKAVYGHTDGLFVSEFVHNHQRRQGQRRYKARGGNTRNQR